MMIMNLDNIFKKGKSLKHKIYPLKLNTFYIKNNNYSESKKDEKNNSRFGFTNSFTFNKKAKINQSISQSLINSNRYITNYDESFYDSKKLHLIKKPYKIFLPIRTKMKKIKNKRTISLNNYYKKTLRNEFILKDIVITDSFNTKLNNSKEHVKKSTKMKKGLKSTVELSNSNQNNGSKNAFLSTERTSTVKEINNISKFNKFNNYDRFKIFSYKCKTNYNDFSNYNINKMTKSNDSNLNEINNDYKVLSFLNMNEGYKNLPSLKNCINNFTNEVKNLTREKYMNFCLKENEATLKMRAESNNDKFKMEMKKKLDNKNLFDIFFNDYNTYFRRLNKKKMKDTDYISLLKWEIISYKNEVNRLNIKKDKLLARLNKYIKMKYFLITMRNYSLDKKDDSWMFHTSNKNNNYSNLIKEKRRIVTPEEHRMDSEKKLHRRSSVEYNISNFNKIILNEDKNRQGKKKYKRMNSSHETNPLAGSSIKEISTILNNHIANLLIYNNQLRIDLEPLKEEFNQLYNSLKISDEKKNQLLKLEFIIYPEKKRIVKERNDFLTNTFFNLNNIIYNASKYNKMNKLIQEKLYKTYKILLDNDIIPLTYLKASINDNIIEQILFYLKNIEKGLSVLFESKRKIMEEYPDVYSNVIKEIHLEIKIKTLEAQRKLEVKKGKEQLDKIADRMNKSIFLNKRKDFYEYGYIRKKKKKKQNKIDPYEELRYSDDISSVKNE